MPFSVEPIRHYALVADGDDPGWKGAWRQVGLWIPIPFVGWRLAKHRVARGDLDALTALRSMFLRFIVALAVFGAVLAFVGSGTGSAPTVPFAGVVVALGLAGLLSRRMIKRPLDCSSDDKLVGSYRAWFFLRVAFAEVVVFWGIVGVFATGRIWLYPLALAFTAIGFALLAPSASNLARDQHELAAAGCSRSLVAALTQDGKHTRSNWSARVGG